DRLHHAGDPVCARFAQHQRHLGAGRRRTGRARAASIARLAAGLRVRVAAACRFGDAGCARSAWCAARHFQCLRVQRLGGRGGRSGTTTAKPNSLAAGEALASPLLIGWATLWALVAIGLQIDNFVAPRFVLAAWLLGLSAIALVFTALSVHLAWPQVAAPLMA